MSTKSRPAVLVHPPVSLEDRYGALASAGSSLPPFALLWLAASAREAGFDSAIVDAEAERLSLDDTVERILSLDPWVVGLTASTLSISRAAAVATRVKQARPEIVTVVGGPHFTAVPERTLAQHRGFDLGVFGEGEDTWVELLSSLRSSSDLDRVAGLVLRREGGAVRTASRPPIEPLDRLPKPAWDLLPDLTRFYQPSALRQHRMPASSLVTSRGCFGTCTFCDNTVFGRRVRTFSADYVCAMIRQLVDRWGVRTITFYDDNFVTQRSRLRELTARLGKEFDLSWSANCRVDVVDPDLLREMRDSGLWQLSWGIESGDQGILDRESKRITIEQIRKAIGWASDAGIRSKGFFIIGHPGETVDSIRKTIDLALDLPLDDFQMSFLTPFPGTRIHAEHDRHGVLDEDWERMNMWTPVFVPHGLTRDELVTWQKTAIRRFYFRPRILWRYLSELTSLARWKAFLRGAMAVARTLWREPPRRPAPSSAPRIASPEPRVPPSQ